MCILLNGALCVVRSLAAFGCAAAASSSELSITAVEVPPVTRTIMRKVRAQAHWLGDASAMGDTSLGNTMSAGDGNGPIAAVAQRLRRDNFIRQVSAPRGGMRTEAQKHEGTYEIDLALKRGCQINFSSVLALYGIS